MNLFFTIFTILSTGFMCLAQDEIDAVVPTTVRCKSAMVQVAASDAVNAELSGIPRVNFDQSLKNPLPKFKSPNSYHVDFLKELMFNPNTQESSFKKWGDNYPSFTFCVRTFFHPTKKMDDHPLQVKEASEDLEPLFKYLNFVNQLKIQLRPMPNSKSWVPFSTGPVDHLVKALDRQIDFIYKNPGKEVPSVLSFIPEKHRTQTHEKYFNEALETLNLMGNPVAIATLNPPPPSFSLWNNAPHPRIQFSGKEFDSEILSPIFDNVALASELSAYLESLRTGPEQTFADLFNSSNLQSYDGLDKIKIRKIAKALAGEIDEDPNHPMRRFMANALPMLVYLNHILVLLPQHPLAKLLDADNANYPVSVEISHRLTDLRRDWLLSAKKDVLGIEAYGALWAPKKRNLVITILRETEARIAEETPERVPKIPHSPQAAQESVNTVQQVPEKPRVTKLLELTIDEAINHTKIEIVKIASYADSVIKAENKLRNELKQIEVQIRGPKEANAPSPSLREINEQIETLDEIMTNAEHVITVLSDSRQNLEDPKKQIERQAEEQGPSSRAATALTVLNEKEMALKTSLKEGQATANLGQELMLELIRQRTTLSSAEIERPSDQPIKAIRSK